MGTVWENGGFIVHIQYQVNYKAQRESLPSEQPLLPGFNINTISKAHNLWIAREILTRM